MAEKTPTPRTDAAVQLAEYYGAELVHADFAREQERMLKEAERLITKLSQGVYSLSNQDFEDFRMLLSKLREWEGGK